MIVKITQSPQNAKLIAVHIVLGAVSTIFPIALILWFYVVLLSSLPHILNGKDERLLLTILFLITYLASFEVLARMARTDPFIPYELGKYIMFVLLVIGLLKKSNISAKGVAMFFLLLPAIFIDESNLNNSYHPYVFNLLGPLNVGLAVAFFQGLKITEEDFIRSLRLIVFASLGVLAYTYITTPKYDEIVFNLQANVQTSGGFGSNQVSTALGLGMFISFCFWINHWKLSGNRFIDGLLAFGFAFQGLLTFSRGGMIGGVISIVIYLFFSGRAARTQTEIRERKSIVKYVILALFISSGAFFIANQISNGLLTLRYQGETIGTQSGAKEKNLNVITSHRYDILLGDIKLWLDNPILGVGVGNSRYLRDKLNGVVAHVELSRVMAEHGILGIIYFLILLSLLPQILRRRTSAKMKGILISLFFIGLYTTFHAAMRTFVSPLLIGLSVLSVVQTTHKSNENIVSRQHAK